MKNIKLKYYFLAISIVVFILLITCTVIAKVNITANAMEEIEDSGNIENINENYGIATASTVNTYVSGTLNWIG